MDPEESLINDGTLTISPPGQGDTYSVPWDGQSYYQRSICSILRSVEDSYGNILLPEESCLVNAILDLPGDSQRLFLRLYLRKTGWFRVEKLEYQDVSNRSDALALLLQENLITGNFDASPCNHTMVQMRFMNQKKYWTFFNWMK